MSLWFKSLCILCCFIAFCLKSSFAAQQDILGNISNYMRQMKTAEGRFIQVDPEGRISQGEFALKRPGKVYFNYADPSPLKVVSDGFWVAVEDRKINSMDRYPLSETPLKILLAENPNLKSDEYNINFEDNGEHYHIHATDPEAPEQGTISLVFTSKPLSLKQWIVTDAQGLQTVVSLQDIKLNAPVKNKLFYIGSGRIQGRR